MYDSIAYQIQLWFIATAQNIHNHQANPDFSWTSGMFKNNTIVSPGPLYWKYFYFLQQHNRLAHYLDLQLTQASPCTPSSENRLLYRQKCCVLYFHVVCFTIFACIYLFQPYTIKSSQHDTVYLRLIPSWIRWRGYGGYSVQYLQVYIGTEKVRKRMQFIPW